MGIPRNGWIPNFRLMAIPLYEALKGHQKSILIFLDMKDRLSLGVLTQNLGVSEDQ